MGSQEKIKLALQSKNQELIGSGIKTKSTYITFTVPMRILLVLSKRYVGPPENVFRAAFENCERK